MNEGAKKTKPYLVSLLNRKVLFRTAIIIHEQRNKLIIIDESKPIDKYNDLILKILKLSYKT